MALSLRLPSDLSARLAAAAGGLPSEYVRRCLEETLAREQTRPSAWELGVSLFGRYGSGAPDLAQNRKSIVKAKMREKTRRR
ncbi:MAG: hypothetical protein U0793_07080 [Gemmataceae bacterium]